MRQILRTTALWAAILASLVLTACGTATEANPSPETIMIQNTPRATRPPSDQAAPAQEMRAAANDPAVATAEIVRAMAEATLKAAQTQDQNSANVAAGQIAATAEIVRAAAQATLVAANSTQGAALTQDAIGQTQVADQATTGAEAVINQQNREDIAAGTQTAVGNAIATQTQIAVATSQWYTDQARQREEQRQRPLAFLWMWCLPAFILVLAGLSVWGFWRWLKIKQNQQRMEGQPPDILEDRFLQPGTEVVNGRFRLTQPDDEMRGWLNEVKSKLLNPQKDDHDHPHS